MQVLKKNIPRSLSVFALAMINLAAIGSVKNWPVTAEYGFSSIFYLLLATLIFFIPVSLIARRLATGWPMTGGVFVWVKEAFGHRAGFLTIWLLRSKLILVSHHPLLHCRHGRLLSIPRLNDSYPLP